MSEPDFETEAGQSGLSRLEKDLSKVQLTILGSKVRKEDDKVFTCRYDNPKKPYQLIMEKPTVSGEKKARLTARRASLCALELLHRTVKICRSQDELSAA